MAPYMTQLRFEARYSIRSIVFFVHLKSVNEIYNLFILLDFFH